VPPRRAGNGRSVRQHRAQHRAAPGPGCPGVTYDAQGNALGGFRSFSGIVALESGFQMVDLNTGAGTPMDPWHIYTREPDGSERTPPTSVVGWRDRSGRARQEGTTVRSCRAMASNMTGECSRRRRALMLACVLKLACHAEPPEAAIAAAKVPTGHALVNKSDDKNLSLLLVEIVSARICQGIRNSYRGLRGLQNPDVVGGTLWVHECTIENDGSNLRLRLSGDGWGWLHKQQDVAAAAFATQQYIKLHVAASIQATLEFSYAPTTKVLTIWLTPSRQPEVQVQSIGNVSVDTQGIWSEIVGSVASVVSETPTQTAKEQIEKQGAQSFASKIEQGLTITVDACTGKVRSAFGHVPAGKPVAPSDQQPWTTPVALHQGGMLMFGPETVSHKMTVVVDVSSGAVHLDIVCRAQADQHADAFLRGAPPPAMKTLASGDVTASARLQVKDGRCPVVVIAQARTPTARFSWKREPPPLAGTPLVDCIGRSASSRGLHPK